jgi:hypothetical protein
MSSMFLQAHRFKQRLNHWNVANETVVEMMFEEALRFKIKHAFKRYLDFLQSMTE